MVWKPAAGAEVVLVSVDSNVGADAGTATAGSIIGDFPGPAAPAGCGDKLLLRLKFVSGTSDYIELGASMSIP